MCFASYMQDTPIIYKADTSDAKSNFSSGRSFIKNRSLSIIFLLLLTLGVGITLYQVQQQNDIRQQAAEQDNKLPWLKDQTGQQEFKQDQVIIRFKPGYTPNVLGVSTQNNGNNSQVLGAQIAVDTQLQNAGVSQVNKLFPSTLQGPTGRSQARVQSQSLTRQRPTVEDRLARTYLIKFSNSVNVKTKIQELSKIPSVEYAEPNYIIKAQVVTPTMPDIGTPALTPTIVITSSNTPTPTLSPTPSTQPSITPTYTLSPTPTIGPCPTSDPRCRPCISNPSVIPQGAPNDTYYIDSYPDYKCARPFYRLRDFSSSNPSYDMQWNMKKIHMLDAWKNAGNNSVIVAVIDSGVDYTHPELGGCTISQVNSNSCPLFVAGYNFYDNNDDPFDDFGHGTHVTGIIAAFKNNGMGIAGMASNVKIMPIKALGGPFGEGSIDSLANAIIYATDRGARVINASWGAWGKSQTLTDAITYAYNNNVVFVAAAGNANREVENFTPANITCNEGGETSKDCTLTVASTDENDEKSFFSNRGSLIDIAAPGGNYSGNILSLKSAAIPNTPSWKHYIFDSNYILFSGTSMAAPHVAGLAAMILGKDPTLSADQVRNIIINGSDDLGLAGFDNFFGYGRINADKSLVSMDTTTPPIARISSPVTDFLVSKKFTITGSSKGDKFSYYKIEYASNSTPDTWQTNGITLANAGNSPVTNGVLANANLTNVTDNGIYYLRLTTITTNGKTAVSTHQIRIDVNLADNFPVPYNTNVLYNSPVVSDINGDGTKEIIFKNGIDATMQAIEPNGSNVPGWPVPIDSIYEADYITNPPVVLDFDSTHPGKEIFQKSLTYYTPAFIGFYSEGKQIPKFSVNDLSSKEITLPNDEISTIALPNNKKGIMVAEGGYKGQTTMPGLHLIDSSGEDAPGFPLRAPLWTTTPIAADLNKDGKSEIIVGYSDFNSTNSVNVYTSDGQLLKQIRIPERVLRVITADIDRDGYTDIIVGATSGKTSKIYVFDRYGSLKSGWPYVIPSFPFQSGDPYILGPYFNAFVATDFNNDGYPDIIANLGDEFEPVGSKYFIVDYKGRLIQNFQDPITPTWLATATLTNGNKLIISSSNTAFQGQINAYEYNPTTNKVNQVSNFPKLYGFAGTSFGYREAFVGSISLTDLENDGKLDLVVPVTYGLTQEINNAFIYAYNLGIPYSYLDWPQNFHDEAHTGNYITSGQTSTPITPADITSPEVKFNNPKNQSNISGIGTDIFVQASDDTLVSSVKIFVDDVLVKTCGSGKTVFCKSYWDYSKVIDSFHALRAEAIDSSNNKTVSEIWVFK